MDQDKKIEITRLGNNLWSVKTSRGPHLVEQCITDSWEKTLGVATRQMGNPRQTKRPSGNGAYALIWLVALVLWSIILGAGNMIALPVVVFSWAFASYWLMEWWEHG